MSPRLHQDRVAGLRVEADGDLVRHGPTGGEQCGIFAEHLGSERLEALHRWVVAQYVVAQLRRLHGSPHAWGWASHGVGAQVDGLHGVLRIG